MKFDNIYVLAKGGVCVYSGLPQDVKTHLSECDIICNEFQVPIELLLKISSNGVNDNRVKKLCTKTSEIRKIIIQKCNDETFPSFDGISFKSKRFIAMDFWNLLLRTMTYTFASQWKALFAQFIVIEIMGFIGALFFSIEITKPNGCLYFRSAFFDSTCTETVEKLEEESLLSQNIKFNFAYISALILFELVMTNLTFSTSVKIFLNEHQNGMCFKKSFKLFCLIYYKTY
jgi:hypothetical protein